MTWTLVFQGVLKALAPIAVIWICISGLPGGIGEFFATNASHHKFDFAILGWDVAFPLVWVMLLRVFLEQTIWQAGDQAVIQRVFASKDDEIRKVTAMNFSCGALIGILVTAMGLAIFAYFHAHPEKFDAGSTIDQIVPLFVIQGMPHGAVGIVIAAIFASAMATVAGAMNSVATIFTVDFYERWFPKADDKANLRMMRMSSIATGVAATLIALWLTTLNLKSILVTWNVVSSLLGGGHCRHLRPGNVQHPCQQRGSRLRSHSQHRVGTLREVLHGHPLGLPPADPDLLRDDHRLHLQLLLPHGSYGSKRTYHLPPQGSCQETSGRRITFPLSGERSSRRSPGNDNTCRASGPDQRRQRLSRRHP